MNTKSHLEGKVVSQKESSKSTVFKIQTLNGEKEAIAFEKINKNFTQKEVKIYGKEDSYKNNPQIIIEKIICTNCNP